MNSIILHATSKPTLAIPGSWYRMTRYHGTHDTNGGVAHLARARTGRGYTTAAGHIT